MASKSRPPSAPKPVLDIRHIRENPGLYEQTCVERHYAAQRGHAADIVRLHAERQRLQSRGRTMRERANQLRKVLAGPCGNGGDQDESARRARARDEARGIKEELSAIARGEADAAAAMEAMAFDMPNLTDPDTPRGDEPVLLRYINGPPPVTTKTPGEPGDGSSAAAATVSEPGGDGGRVWRSHVDIGAELGILDFAGAAAASGWGWYYLMGEAAQLEQALVQHALSVTTRRGWTPVAPPTLVYSHVVAACGFRPRDQQGKQQVYTLESPPPPARCLAGTSEVALAGMAAGATLDAGALPLRRVAASRCYRAEAGARGLETKGLYRVHEFTKVELFAWTAPDRAAARAVLDDMIAVQAAILAPLGLPCRVLAMPARDLGASAALKVDVEAFFPSRRTLPSAGWGELTSASLCTDYQARRLATRLRLPGGSLAFPYTVNATALAVPRVLAALLEHGWDERSATVAIPPCLRPWMDGRHTIGGRNPGHATPAAKEPPSATP